MALSIYYGQRFGVYQMLIGGVLGTVASVVAVLLVRYTTELTDGVLSIMPVMWVVGTSLIDMSAATSRTQRVWPVFILDTTFLLYMGVKFVYVRCIVVFSLVHCIVAEAETVAQFSVFQYGKHSGEGRWDKVCGCDSRPCPTDNTATWLTNAAIVSMVLFCLNYFVVKLVDELDRETSRALQTVMTVQEVACTLADMDLEAAEYVLSEPSKLHKDMQAALCQILHIMKTYRPYLPEGLVDELVATQESQQRAVCNAAAPGLSAAGADEDGDVSIVFTDIRASTQVWDRAPDTMKRALKIHNEAVRECIAQFGGYEVKIIGDSFMVAFGSVVSATAFSFAVHKALLAEKWPSALLQIPLCRREGVWGGLTVRIGVHCGEVTAEMNDVVGRADYYGATVNAASRLESLCPPGMVLASQAVMVALGIADKVGTTAAVRTCRRHGLDFNARYMGPQELKGIEGHVGVFTLLPTELAARRDASPSNPLLAAELPRQMSRVLEENSGQFGSSISCPVQSGLTRVASATVGTVHLTLSAEEETGCVNRFLHAVVACLDRTEGRFVSLLSSSVLVSWNAGHPVPRHVELSILFVQQFHPSKADLQCVIGLATGSAVHGRVGTDKKRFLTVLGRSVTASEWLCRYAQLEGKHYCFASLDSDVNDWPASMKEPLVTLEEMTVFGNGAAARVCEVQVGSRGELPGDRSSQTGVFGAPTPSHSTLDSNLYGVNTITNSESVSRDKSSIYDDNMS